MIKWYPIVAYVTTLLYLVATSNLITVFDVF